MFTITTIIHKSFDAFKKRIPTRVLNFIVRWTSPVKRQLSSSNQYFEGLYGDKVPDKSTYKSNYLFTIGILKDRGGYYTYNVIACQEMGVQFVVFDLERNTWYEKLFSTPCDAYLVWPSTNLSIWKNLYDERLLLLANITGKPIVPSLSEIWLWESKRRMRDWLVANKLPHPNTQIFYDQDQAILFAKDCPLPIVLKMNSGAASDGVFILSSRKKLYKMIKKAFGFGIASKRGDPRDRSWGYIILQEYISHDFEWRIVRIGENYLCRCKKRVGDFASGSGDVVWGVPQNDLLNFVKSLTDKGGFKNMSIDVFIVERIPYSSQFLVNELQCLVGAKELSQHSGRWRFIGEQWVFETGDFYRNASANLRLACLIESLGDDLFDYSFFTQ